MFRRKHTQSGAEGISSGKKRPPSCASPFITTVSNESYGELDPPSPWFIRDAPHQSDKGDRYVIVTAPRREVPLRRVVFSTGRHGQLIGIFGAMSSFVESTQKAYDYADRPRVGVIENEKVIQKKKKWSEKKNILPRRKNQPDSAGPGAPLNQGPTQVPTYRVPTQSQSVYVYQYMAAEWTETS